MPKKSKCIDCQKVCHGQRCRKCDSLYKTKWNDRKDAQRQHHYVKKYNITVDEFEIMWIAFRGKCGICNCMMIRPLEQKGQPLNTVCVDHDHKTGKIRGLLCSKCNKGLGFFEDNKTLLESAKKYLEIYNE